MPIIYAGLTDIGKKRKSNQDSILLLPEHNLFLVADGMGGHNGGDIASQKVVEIFSQLSYDPKDHSSPSEFLSKSIEKCNREIFEEAQRESTLKGMGTTITCVFIWDNRIYIGNVGDSRTYLISQEKIFQMTKDHSLVQEKVNHGIYSRNLARRDPMKNILIRSVGFEKNVSIDIFEYRLSENDLFLLCSDGLYNKLSDEALIEYLKEKVDFESESLEDELNKAALDLVAEANKEGGEDNISIILLCVKSLDMKKVGS